MSPVKPGSLTEKQARIFSLFGDPTRLAILKMLAKNKAVNVTDIAKHVGMSIACISHHLQLLKDNTLVSAKREGNSIFYQLADNPFIKQLTRLF